jgi:hypothetical protein
MQTEYQRLDVDPKPAGKSLLHDKNGMRRVAKKPQKQMPRAPEISNEPIKVPAKRVDEDSISYRNKKVPKQPMAYVGMHEDQMWFDEELVASGDKLPPEEEMIDNNEDVDVTALQGHDPLASTWADRMEDQPDYTQDAEPPDSPTPAPEEGVEEIESLGFELGRGEYAVLMNGQLIVKYDDLDYVRRVVEDMILTHNIEVSTITVVKSIPIDFGVLLKGE